MRIDHIKVEVTPVGGQSPYEHTLRIVVTAESKKFSLLENYGRNDLRSHFDEVFDRARRVLRDGLEHPERFEEEPWKVML
jgi:hypothetical protein